MSAIDDIFAAKSNKKSAAAAASSAASVASAVTVGAALGKKAKGTTAATAAKKPTSKTKAQPHGSPKAAAAAATTTPRRSKEDKQSDALFADSRGLLPTSMWHSFNVQLLNNNKKNRARQRDITRTMACPSSPRMSSTLAVEEVRLSYILKC